MRNEIVSNKSSGIKPQGAPKMHFVEPCKLGSPWSCWETHQNAWHIFNYENCFVLKHVCRQFHELASTQSSLHSLSCEIACFTHCTAAVYSWACMIACSLVACLRNGEGIHEGSLKQAAFIIILYVKCNCHNRQHRFSGLKWSAISVQSEIYRLKSGQYRSW